MPISGLMHTIRMQPDTLYLAGITFLVDISSSLAQALSSDALFCTYTLEIVSKALVLPYMQV